MIDSERSYLFAVPKKPLQAVKKAPKSTPKPPKKVPPKTANKAAKSIPGPSSNVSSSSVMPMPTLTAVQATVTINAHNLTPAPSSVPSSLIRPLPGPVVLKTKEEQAAVQMAKFPKIAPSPFTVTTPNTTSAAIGSTSSPIVSINHRPKVLPPKPVTVTPNPPTSLVQVLHSNNPIKSSPILASQLQAPVVSSLTKQINLVMDAPSRIRPNLVVHQEFNKLRSGLSDFPPQVMKLYLKSEDEVESSSEDEFEAIEPTIGFSTNFSMLPTVSKIQQQSKTGPKTPHSRSSSIGTNHKILPSKPKQVLNTIPKISGSPTAASTYNPVNKAGQNIQHVTVNSNVKITNSHILLTSPSINVNTGPSMISTTTRSASMKGM